MPVTKEQHPKRPAQRLVEFLNYNYVAGSKEVFIQREIRRFILPLFLAKPELIEFHLGALMGEIRRMGRDLKPDWTWHRVEESRKLRFGERHVRIQNTKWVVSKTSLASGLRESLFQDVVSSLEAGDFGLLRRCPICEIFFVAKDFRQELCGSVKCKRKRDNDTARGRVAEYREREREAKKTSQLDQEKALLAVNDRKGFEYFRDYMKLREKRNPSQADENRLWEVTKHLPKRNQTPIEWDKQIRKGLKPENIWKSEPLSVRSVFLSAARSEP